MSANKYDGNFKATMALYIMVQIPSDYHSAYIITYGNIFYNYDIRVYNCVTMFLTSIHQVCVQCVSISCLRFDLSWVYSFILRHLEPSWVINHERQKSQSAAWALMFPIPFSCFALGYRLCIYLRHFQPLSFSWIATCVLSIAPSVAH